MGPSVGPSPSPERARLPPAVGDDRPSWAVLAEAGLTEISECLEAMTLEEEGEDLIWKRGSRIKKNVRKQVKLVGEGGG